MTELAGPAQVQIFSLVEQALKGDSTLTVEESIRCINACIDMGNKAVRNVLAQDVLFVIGDTGVGKSACVNYLLGCEMIYENYKIKVSPHSKIPEVMAIGHGRLSKTFLPEVKKNPDAELTFCDSPGFHDTRSPDLRIANAVNIRNVFSSAKSVKILLLIDCDSIFDTRKRGMTALINIITELFGSAENLSNFANNVLIGVTRPCLIEGKQVRLKDIQTELLDDAQFPKTWVKNTFIIDPLLSQDANDRFGPETWTKHIQNLTPISTTTLFKTVLTADDKIHLMKISRSIGSKIMSFVRDDNPEEAANYLSLLLSLKTIGHSEVDMQYRENVLALCNYVQEKNALIKNMIDLRSHLAEKELLGLQHLITVFESRIPELKDKLTDVHAYAALKKTQNNTVAVYDAIDEFTHAFYTVTVSKSTLARSIVDIMRSKTARLTCAADFEQTLKTLCAMSQVPGIGITISHSISAIQASFSDLLETSDNDHLNILKTACFEALHHLFEAANQHNDATMKVNLTFLEMDISDCLEWFTRNIKWETNGKRSLSTLSTLTDHFDLNALDNVIKEFAKDFSLMRQAVFLRAAMVSYVALCHEAKGDLVLNKQIQRVGNHLLRIKGKLNSFQEIDKKHHQALLKKRAEMEIQIADKKARLQAQVEKNIAMKIQLNIAKQARAERLLQQQAAQNKVAGYALSKDQMEQKKFKLQERKEELAFKKQAHQLILETQKRSLETAKVRKVEQERVNEISRRQLEEKKREQHALQEKVELIRQTLARTKSKKESLKNADRTQKAQLEQRQAIIAERKANIAAKQAEISKAKAIVLAKNNEKQIRIQKQKDALVRAKQAKSATGEEIRQRQELKRNISQWKLNMRTISVGLKNKVIPKDASYNIPTLTYTSALCALEETLLKHMQATSVRGDRLTNQIKRLQLAQTGHQRMRYSMSSLFNAIHLYNQNSYRGQDVLSEMDMSETNHIPDDVVDDNDAHNDDAPDHESVNDTEYPELDREIEYAETDVQDAENDLSTTQEELTGELNELKEEQMESNTIERALSHVETEVQNHNVELDNLEMNAYNVEQSVVAEEARLSYEEKDNGLNGDIIAQEEAGHVDLQEEITEVEESQEQVEIEGAAVVEQEKALAAEETLVAEETKQLEDESTDAGRAEEELIEEVDNTAKEEDALNLGIQQDEKDLEDLAPIEEEADEELSSLDESDNSETLPDFDEVFKDLSSPEDVNEFSEMQPDEAQDPLESNNESNVEETVSTGQKEPADEERVPEPPKQSLSPPEPGEESLDIPPTTEIVGPITELMPAVNIDPVPTDVSSDQLYNDNSSHPIKSEEEAHLPTPPSERPSESSYSNRTSFFPPEKENEGEKTVGGAVNTLMNELEDLVDGPTSASEHREQASEAATTLVEKVGNHMGGMMDDVVTGNATGLENKIADVNSDVSNALDVVATHYEKEVGDVAEAAADVVSTVGSVMAETAGDVVNTLGDAVSNFFSSETEADEPTYNP